MQSRTLLAVAGVAFVVSLLATAPASLVASRLPPGVLLEDPSGSVFRGQARDLNVNGDALGELRWSWRPLTLLHGAFGYHIELKGRDGHLAGDVAAGLGGRLLLNDVTLDLPLAALSGATGTIGGEGRLSGEIREARLKHGWPWRLDATLLVADLKPAMASVPIGSYEVRFAPSVNGAIDGVVVGAVKDAKAPLSVEGMLTLKPDRTYTLEGSVTPKPDAPKELLPVLSMLGPADPRGRHAFSVGGIF